jgi:hypothetical protein
VQSADPDHVLVSEAVAAECAAERGLPPPAVRAIAAKGKPDGIRCARFDWRAAAFVDHGWPPPPLPVVMPPPPESPSAWAMPWPSTTPRPSPIMQPASAGASAAPLFPPPLPAVHCQLPAADEQADANSGAGAGQPGDEGGGGMMPEAPAGPSGLVQVEAAGRQAATGGVPTAGAAPASTPPEARAGLVGPAECPGHSAVRAFTVTGAAARAPPPP